MKKCVKKSKYIYIYIHVVVERKIQVSRRCKAKNRDQGIEIVVAKDAGDVKKRK